jgi:hypothetical protein
LISGVVEEQVLSAYHEINAADLTTQMQLFRCKRILKSVGEVANISREMVPEVGETGALWDTGA